MSERAKKLEAIGRIARCYTSLKAIRSYFAILKSRKTSAPEGKKTIAIDIHRLDIDSDAGRYIYFLFKDILASGHNLCVRDNYTFLATCAHKRYKKKILELPFTLYRAPSAVNPVLVITDRNNSIYGDTKTVTVDYSKRLATTPLEINMPYCSHPNSLDTETKDLPNKQIRQRAKRVFFAGAATRPKYANPDLSKKFGVLSRADALETVLSHKKANSEAFNEVTLFHKPSHRVPADKWLETLADSVFYLSLPGVNMPLSHNLVECLSVGCIPILEYAHHLHPELIHGVNCLTYSDETSLIEVIDRALKMPIGDIEQMAENARQYYDSNLKTGRLTKALLMNSSHSLTLLFNSYLAPRASKNEKTSS